MKKCSLYMWKILRVLAWHTRHTQCVRDLLRLPVARTTFTWDSYEVLRETANFPVAVTSSVYQISWISAKLTVLKIHFYDLNFQKMYTRPLLKWKCSCHRNLPVFFCRLIFFGFSLLWFKSCSQGCEFSKESRLLSECSLSHYVSKTLKHQLTVWVPISEVSTLLIIMWFATIGQRSGVLVACNNWTQLATIQTKVISFSHGIVCSGW